jgi:hypothetical protein
MARGKSVEDLTTIQMALVGYEIEKQRIEGKIRELQARLGGKKVTAPSAEPQKKAPGTRRALSAAARRRISLAQKKRWAEHRRAQAKGE